MRRSLPISSLLLAIAALLWHAVPLATASPQPPSPSPGQEIRADAFSVAELAADARGVKIGGGLIVSGLQIEADSPSAVLDLQRFQVFTDDARVVVHSEGGEEVLLAPDNAYFRGRVDGDPDSLALLSVLPSGRVRGLVQRDGQVYVLRPARLVSGPSSAQGAAGANNPDAADTGGPGSPTAATDAASGPVPLEAVAAASLEEGKEGFTCANTDLSLSPPADLTSGAAGNQSDPFAADFASTGAEAIVTPYTARMAIETDWEYYQIFGNTTAATDYIGDLIAFSSTIYDAEVDTDLQISHISLWSTSADPWDQFSTICGLFEFGQYWNYNRTGVERTLAHFLSGKDNGGGVAWIGVLCQGAFATNISTYSCTGLSPDNDYYGGDYGYTGTIDGDFDPDNPFPVWDITAVSHEIGHNFNSPHTHCYEGIGGSSSAVDECYGSQSGSSCYSGAVSYPDGCPGGGQGCGTIMSYCHFLSGGQDNIGLTLGEGHPYGTLPGRVPDRMRAHVENVASGAPACLARIEPCTEDLELTSGTDNGTESYSVCGTITAGGTYKVGSSGDVTMTAGRVVLTDGFRVESGGTLRIDV